jgi:hypothetical protein
MKKWVFFFVICANFSLIFAQEPKKEIYSGGMLFYQPGYTIAHNPHQDIVGFSNSIGGILRFYFWDHFTCGIYGGSQKTHYNTTHSPNSYMNLGYGGLFAGGVIKSGKFRFVLSLFAGKGAITNLHIESENQSVLQNAFLYKYGVFVFSPIFSTDYMLTSKISFTTQILFLTSQVNKNEYFFNPTFQIGILFNR